MGVSMNMTNFLKRFGSDNSGATAIEYGLIASLIVISSIGAFNAFADEENNIWAKVTQRVVEVTDRQR